MLLTKYFPCKAELILSFSDFFVGHTVEVSKCI